MKVELFSAGCRLCTRALDILKQNFPGLDTQVHRASECTDGSCCALAAEYGVRAVPSLVVDGRVVCVGVPDDRDLQLLKSIFTGEKGHGKGSPA